MPDLPKNTLHSLQDRIAQQRQTIASLKKDGHEHTDAERHLKDLLVEESLSDQPRAAPKPPQSVQK